MVDPEFEVEVVVKFVDVVVVSVEFGGEVEFEFVVEVSVKFGGEVKFEVVVKFVVKVVVKFNFEFEVVVVVVGEFVTKLKQERVAMDINEVELAVENGVLNREHIDFLFNKIKQLESDNLILREALKQRDYITNNQVADILSKTRR